MTERSIAVTTHGRYLIHPPAIAGPAPILVGFHGYAEDAEIQLERLRALPGSDRWLIVSIQGLHQFYNRRTNQIVASWMTRQNREAAIADNLAYVAACLDAVDKEWQTQPSIVFVGFSQGVAMAFRAAAHSTREVRGVIAVGGDVPPEIPSEGLKEIPAVVIARGKSDPLYSADQFAIDAERLRQDSVKVLALNIDAGHEWYNDLGSPLDWLLSN